jgi:predicted lipoprotein with Yx(FWY)xxD motif
MKRLHLFFFSIILLLLTAACGSSYSTTSGSSYGNTSSNAPTPIATTGGAAASTPTPAASTTGAVIHTASATVNGKTVTLLTNAQGMTLYYFQPDTATTSACTGGCASVWPPYLSSATPTQGTLSGTLALQTNANGSQITYNGHPLYHYSGDTAPGQTNGEGISNMWFVATNDLAVLKGGSSAGGYGY